MVKDQQSGRDGKTDDVWTYTHHFDWVASTDVVSNLGNYLIRGRKEFEVISIRCYFRGPCNEDEPVL